MSKVILLLITLSVNIPALCQLKVIYGVRNNGEEIKNDSVVVFISKESEKIERPALNKESQFVDYTSGKTVQLLRSNNNEIFLLRKDINNDSEGLSNLIEYVNGFSCRKAELIIRSNKFEIWFTEYEGFRGSPGLSFAGIPGLVVKVIRNGNYELYLKNIEKSENNISLSKIPDEDFIELDEAGFQQKLIESRYEKINIFRGETINYGNYDVQKNQSVLHLARGNIIATKINLADYKNGRIVIAELRVKSKGDAYDRLGSVFAVPVSEKNNYIEGLMMGIESLPESQFKGFKGISIQGDYHPPVELMRFITSFGAGHYGNQIMIKGYEWKEEIIYRQDISDLVNGMTGEYWFCAFIGNYDRNGHELSLDLKIFNEDEYESASGYIPLFNTINLLEAEGVAYNELFKNGSFKCSFDIPNGKKNLKLRYITTGHGDDEFIKKENKILIDGKVIYSGIPWRTDCATYRENNPASGNFSNGMSSSDYSRSNWCPGMVVIPFEIQLANIEKGRHEIEIVIDCGKNSNWAISGCLIYN